MDRDVSGNATFHRLPGSTDYFASSPSSQAITAHWRHSLY